jgi:GNAT superfamily N-acetyltransferase
MNIALLQPGFGALWLLVAFVLALYIVGRLYIRVRFRFWAIQPVFHVYNIGYWLGRRGVIHPSCEPGAHGGGVAKYLNFFNIHRAAAGELSAEARAAVAGLIQTHYTPAVSRGGGWRYAPTEQQIFSNLESKNAFVCRYFVDGAADGDARADRLAGCVTSRPVEVFFGGGGGRGGRSDLTAFYVDYLCVAASHRRKGIAPQLIQTIEHHQRTTNDAGLCVSLFKREGQLNFMVPLVAYNCYTFNITHWNLARFAGLLSDDVALVAITDENFDTFYHALATVARGGLFACCVVPPAAVLKALIDAGALRVFVLLNRGGPAGTVVACYVFKTETVSYVDPTPTAQRTHAAVECVATVSTTDDYTFRVGFYKAAALLRDQSDEKYTIMSLENVGHTGVLIDQTRQNKHRPLCVTPMAYYFYNYVSKPFRESEVLLLL